MSAVSVSAPSPIIHTPDCAHPTRCHRHLLVTQALSSTITNSASSSAIRHEPRHYALHLVKSLAGCEVAYICSVKKLVEERVRGNILGT